MNLNFKIYFFFGGGGGGVGVRLGLEKVNCFYKEFRSKKKKFFFFFFFFFLRGGGAEGGIKARVTEFFLQRIQIKKRFLGVG